METSELISDIKGAEYKINMIMAELRHKYPDFNMFVNESTYEINSAVCGVIVQVKTTITATIKY